MFPYWLSFVVSALDSKEQECPHLHPFFLWGQLAVRMSSKPLMLTEQLVSLRKDISAKVLGGSTPYSPSTQSDLYEDL